MAKSKQSHVQDTIATASISATTTPKTAPTPVNSTTTSSETSLAITHNSLWYRIHVLIYDLRHFTDDSSLARLNTATDPTYIGAPYFSAAEAQLVKATKLDGSTLEKVFESTMKEKLKKREEKGEKDFRMCAPHDLAPLFERAFDVKYTKLNKSKHFRDLLRKEGLELKEGQRFKGV